MPYQSRIATTNPTGNILWVDAINGNDSTGTRGRFDKPFITITAANVAASSGDVVNVRPGTYDEGSVLKNGVHLHLQTGAILSYSGTTFDGVITDTAAVIIARISGNGIIQRVSPNAGGRHVISITNASSSVEIVAADIFNTPSDAANGDSACVYQTAGILNVYANSIVSTFTGSGSDTLWWQNGQGTIRAGLIKSTGASTSAAIYSNCSTSPTGDWHIFADRIEANQWAMSDLSTNSSAVVWVRANTIKTTGTHAFFGFFNTDVAKIYIVAEKIFGKLKRGGQLLYVTAQKLEAVGNNPVIYEVGTSGVSRYQIGQIAENGATGVMVDAAGGTTYLELGDYVASTSSGILVEGGNLNINGGVINTSAINSIDALTVTSGTLNLQGCSVTSNVAKKDINQSGGTVNVINGRGSNVDGTFTTTGTINLLSTNLSNIPTSNTLWVDAINGNDSIGLRQRQDKPFLTLNAAKTAASSGDTIIVYPGTFNENNLLKNGVNWHFMPGAVVTYTNATVSDVPGIFDDSSLGANGPVVCTIAGEGRFSYTPLQGNSLGLAGVLAISNAGSSVRMRAAYMMVGTQATSCVNHHGGTINLTVDVIENPNNAGYNIWWFDGDCYIKAKRIRSARNGCIASGSTTVPTGKLWVEADTIVGTGNARAILTNDTNSSATVWVIAKEITTATGGSSIDISNNGKLYITAQKLANTHASGSLIGTLTTPFTGNCWLNIDKLSVTGTGSFIDGTNLNGNIWLRATSFESLGIVTTGINFAAGTLVIYGGDTITATNGLTISGGTVSLHGLAIDSSASASSNPIIKSGGTLKLDSVSLNSNGSRDVITATSAQTVNRIGNIYGNNAINGNITLTGTAL